jgi:hypothetical protein
MSPSTPSLTTISSAPALVLSIRGLAGDEVIVIGNGTADFDKRLALFILLEAFPVCVLLRDVDNVDPLPVAGVCGEEYAEAERDELLDTRSFDVDGG